MPSGKVYKDKYNNIGWDISLVEDAIRRIYGGEGSKRVTDALDQGQSDSCLNKYGSKASNMPGRTTGSDLHKNAHFFTLIIFVFVLVFILCRLLAFFTLWPWWWPIIFILRFILLYRFRFLLPSLMVERSYFSFQSCNFLSSPWPWAAALNWVLLHVFPLVWFQHLGNFGLLS